jgi:hypothetical protein
MTVSVMQGSTSVVSETVGLTITSPGCSSSLSNVTCTHTLSLSAGSYTASITTYDGTNGTGNQLSTAQNVGFTVVANQNNVVPLSLSGIPMKIIAMAGNTANSVYVIAEDADGNFIVGSGAPTFTATGTGASVATISEPTSTAPNTISFALPSPAPSPGTETIGVKASYPPGQTNACAVSGAVCAVATPITVSYSKGTAFLADYEYNGTIGFSLPLTSNTQAPSVTFGGLGYPYGGVVVNSSGTLFTWGYYYGSSLVSTPPYTSSVETAFTTIGLAESYYQGAVAPNGDVFIPDFPTSIGALAILAPPYTGAATIITAGIDYPLGAAADSNSNLYVANQGGNGSVTMYAPSYTSVTATLTVTGDPYGIYLSGSKLYVLEQDYVDVFNLPVTSSSTPAATLTMPGYAYSAALDAKGNLWVACYADCGSTLGAGSVGAVYEFTTPFSTGENPAVTLTMPAPGFISYEPTGIGFDAAGNLYVENYSNATANEYGGLLEYSGTITSSSTPVYAIETPIFDDPFGMAIAPPAFTVTP